MKIILATRSKYKIKAMRKLGIKFVVKRSSVNESCVSREDPRLLVLKLAELKAKDVSRKYKEGIIIGMDSVGFFNNRILEKPKSKKEAIGRLKRLSGRTHYAYTGIYIIYKKGDKLKSLSRVVKTKIIMRELSNDEIEKYVKSDENILSYCLGYDPDSALSSSFIKEIEGSYNNILSGTPIEVITEMLNKVVPSNLKDNLGLA